MIDGRDFPCWGADNFWDATLARVPQRKETLASLKKAGLLSQTPPRRVVLDREVQHLNICPSSQDVVRNCRIIQRVSLVAMAGWLVNAFVRKATNKWWIPVVSGVVAWAAQAIRKQFYFCYPENKRDKDLASIPTKMWLDPQ